MTGREIDRGRLPGSLIGYARLSRCRHSDDAQVEALIHAGVPEERLYVDEGPRRAAEVPVLARAMEDVRRGDTLVVWRLERIATSIVHLRELVERLDAAGGYLRSLAEGFDTRPDRAAALRDVVRGMARLEKDLVVERARVGRAKAMREGVSFGRTPVLRETDMPEVRRLRHEEGWAWKRIGERFGVTAGTAARRARAFEATLASSEVNNEP